MSFDQFLRANFTSTLQQQFYGTSNTQDLSFLQFSSPPQNADEDISEEPVPMQQFNFFSKSGDLKIDSIPLPDDVEQEDQIDFQGKKNQQPTQMMVEPAPVEPVEPAPAPPAPSPSPPPRNLNDYYKNFLVILSGWLRNHFLTLVHKKQMQKQDFKYFEWVVIPPPEPASEESSSEGGRKNKRRKIYINLNKFSLLFNHEGLKVHLENFLDLYFLRYLAASKTKNKACLLRFLPVLKQGLMEGRIVRLRG